VEVVSVDPSCELESLIVVVEIILKLGRQQEGGQNHLVYVKIAETEVWLLHVVSVDVDDGDNQTFRRKLGVLVEPSQEIFQCDVRDR
jgi:hypothetical protein